MSTSEVIELMKSLPAAERAVVLHYFDEAEDTVEAVNTPSKGMEIDEAIEHVFKNYDGLLAKLAK
jgi:hypothetical protein